MVLSHKVKRYPEGFRVICLRWWKRKVVCGVFKWIGGKCGVFVGTWKVSTLGGSGPPEVE